MLKNEVEKNDTCRPEIEKIKQDKYQCPDDGSDFILHKEVPNKQGTESQDLYHCPTCHKDYQKGTVENP